MSGPWLWVLALAATVMGCATLPAPPSIPETLPGIHARAGVPDNRPPEPILRPGDRVTVEIASLPPRVYEDLEVSATGILHVPGLGEVAAGDHSVAVVEARIRTRLRRQDVLGEVSLRRAPGDTARYTILGAVRRQGVRPVLPEMRVADAIAAAGGLLTTPAAAPDAERSPMPLAVAVEITVTRDGKTLPIDVERTLARDPMHDPYVRPGDHIHVVVRARNTVTVLGQVRAPLLARHWQGMRMTEALALAGGVTTDGDRSDIRLVRGPVDAPRVYSASLSGVVNGTQSDVILAPGDLLFVTDSWIEDVGEVLGLFAPLGVVAGTAVLVAVASTR